MVDRLVGQFQTIIIPLCGPTCKLRLASWNSTRVEFQVGPSVAILLEYALEKAEASFDKF